MYRNKIHARLEAGQFCWEAALHPPEGDYPWAEHGTETVRPPADAAKRCESNGLPELNEAGKENGAGGATRTVEGR